MVGESVQSTFVPGFGPANAKIVFVGEAPGAEEVFQRRPFVGGSGRLLRALSREAGINPDLCYYTNVCKIRPASNDFSEFYKDPKRREPSSFLINSIQDLKNEILQIRPNVIVPLGAEPLRALTGHTEIGNWRGSILNTPIGKCVPSYHPAFVLRFYEAHPILQLDLRRVAQEALDCRVNTPTPKFLIDPTIEQIFAWLDRPWKRIAFDIETTGDLIRCIGFAGSSDEALCVPLISTQRSRIRAGEGTVLFLPPAENTVTINNHWTEEEEYAILARIYKLFSDPSIEKVAHNYPFDAERLARQLGMQINNFRMDTMVAFHTCYAELPKGLDFLASVYTRIPYYSDYDTASDTSTWIYNCWDCVATYDSSVHLERDMVELGVDEYYEGIKHPAVSAFLRVEQRGVRINQDLRSEWTYKTKTQVSQLSQALRIMTKGRLENPASPDQLKEYLYGELNLQVQYNHKTKRPTTDKHAIEKLSAKYDEHRMFFQTFSEFQQATTTLEFLEREVSDDGRMRTHYSVAGTLSDRFNSAKPMFEPGTNLQNIPRGNDPKRSDYGFRRLFIPTDPSWVLQKCDLSQAEFRIVAWLAEVKHVIQKYTENPSWDVHRWVASLIFKKPEDQISKEERSIAKNGVYGGNYAMQDKTAARTYKLEIQLARFVLNAYRTAIPEIPRWWGRVQRVLRSNRTIRGPLGASRIFFGRIDDEDTYRKAYAHSASHVVAGIINRAGCLAETMFPTSECHVLLQVHDELVFQTKRSLVDSYAGRIRSLLEYPIRFPGVEQPLIIPADVCVGDNWHDQIPVKEWLEKEREAKGTNLK